MKEPSNINRGRFEDRTSSATTDSRPFSRIFQEIVNHLSEIVRSEVRLARTEVRQDLTQLTRSSMVLIIGGAFAMFAVGFLLLGVVYALETRMAPWLSAVIVGTGVGILAVIFLQVGRMKVRQASLRPDKTIQSLRENVTWMKKQIR